MPVFLAGIGAKLWAYLAAAGAVFGGLFVVYRDIEHTGESKEKTAVVARDAASEVRVAKAETAMNSAQAERPATPEQLELRLDKGTF